MPSRSRDVRRTTRARGRKLSPSRILVAAALSFLLRLRFCMYSVTVRIFCCGTFVRNSVRKKRILRRQCLPPRRWPSLPLRDEAPSATSTERSFAHLLSRARYFLRKIPAKSFIDVTDCCYLFRNFYVRTEKGMKSFSEIISTNNIASDVRYVSLTETGAKVAEGRERRHRPFFFRSFFFVFLLGKLPVLQSRRTTGRENVSRKEKHSVGG